MGRDSKDINSFSHFLVPKHSIASKEEVDQFLKKYDIELSQLPKISIRDPAIKHLDVKVGDVIKVERIAYTNNKPYVVYRVVIE